MNRRRVLMAGASAAAALAASWAAIGFLGRPGERFASLETDESLFEVTHSEAEWRRMLSRAEFLVLRQEETERPFSSPLNSEKRAGIYLCAGCALPVYSSRHKFDSGTGWPSFYRSLENAVRTKPDYALFAARTEVHCRRCGGHFGHVFDDGPEPTGKRHCLNGLALDFRPEAGA
jgi:peptide-methionine (R)-S-oxide reductase